MDQAASHATQGEARIGPNAILQVAEALRDHHGEETARQVFDRAGLLEWLTSPPSAMVPESTVAALHQAVRQQLDADTAAELLRDAGVRTGHYVRRNRIPAPVRAILRYLPPVASGPILLSAIERHAWTFVGSGTLVIHRGRPCVLELTHNPVLRGEQAPEPICHWHAAAFETLFRELVSSHATVRETACEAAGDDACRFELSYR